MKQTVTISNKHLQEIFYRHNLSETAETSVTNETGLKKKIGHLLLKKTENNENE